MRPYSSDLRERIVVAIDRGEHSLRHIARLFAVNLSFLVRLLQRRRATGSVQPKPHAWVLRKHHITRKKKTPHAQERDRPRVQEQRVAFLEKLAAVDPEHLVFVDEFGATTAMTRRYGRAAASERVEYAMH